MSRQDEYVSWFFYDFLCKTIGTEDAVHFRRIMYNKFDRKNLFDNSNFRQITGGSKAEGLDLEGSDIDVMLIFTLFEVFEDSIQEHLNFDERKISLILNTHFSKLGFTRLMSLRDEYIIPHLNPIIYKSEIGLNYISSKGLREHVLPNHKDLVIHGPCSSMINGSLDCVFCLHGPRWIYLAENWFTRPRVNKLSSALTDSIKNFGVLFVPIGSKGSKYEDTEFRISFSVAEKMLISAFNHVQFLCYALMKIVLNEILKKNFGKSLCSYIMKTIILWICEETDSSVWVPPKILFCFMNCFKRLQYFVKYKTCPHYFIPKVNLFEDKLDFIERKQLLFTLQSLSYHDYMLLLQAKTMQPLRDLFEPLPVDVLAIVRSLPRNFYETVEKIRNIDPEVRNALELCKAESYSVSDYILYVDKAVYQYYKDWVW